MKRCPFHTDSVAELGPGDIISVRCSACGDYRISGTAMEQLAARLDIPSGWTSVITHRAVISTRDTRELA